MPNTYFISNDTEDDTKPSSTYCFEVGVLGRGRYKGATNSATGHEWWLYCASVATADTAATCQSLSGRSSLKAFTPR